MFYSVWLSLFGAVGKSVLVAFLCHIHSVLKNQNWREYRHYRCVARSNSLHAG